MKRRYRYTFELFVCGPDCKDPERAAIAFCGEDYQNSNSYKRANYPAIWRPWTSPDGKERGYIVHYYCK